MISVRPVTVLVLLFVCQCLFADIVLPWQAEREWKSSNGKFSSSARYVGEIDGAVVLKKQDGKLIEVDRQSLSKADHEFLHRIPKRELESPEVTAPQKGNDGLRTASAEYIIEESEALAATLKKFKDRPDFHEFGFSKRPYSTWKDRVKALSREATKAKNATSIDIAVTSLPGNLLLLGNEYQRTKGKENNFTHFFFDEMLPEAKGQAKTGPLVLNPQDKQVVSQTESSISYTIISDSGFGSIKRSVDIRIDGKATREQIAQFAHEIRKKDSKKYDRIFICYYLPGMKVDEGAWATSHFEKDKLDVRFTGIMPE